MIRKKSNNQRIKLPKNVVIFFLLFSSLSLLAIIPRVRNIECLVDGHSDQDICTQLSFLKNKSLFFTNLEKTALYEQVLLNKVGQVFLPIKVQKKLPQTLMITLSREDPLYRLSFQNEVFLVNSKNFLAEDSDQFDLPSIHLTDLYINNINGKKLDSTLNIKISKLTSDLSEANLIFEKIEFDGQNSSLRVNGIKFIFSDDNIELLVPKVSSILNDFQNVESQIPENQQLEEIDMRFDLPIVRFK